MNILLILTGGTIACKTVNSTMNPTAQNACDILRMYKTKNPNCDINFSVEQPFTILSENLEPSYLERLVNFISSKAAEGYDGIIVTHGSDTLSYSSAMLGLCLHGLGIPVVITASDYVPDDPASNALYNFSAAAALACRMKSGVCTVYKNPCCKRGNVFIPTRLEQADRINDIFSYAGSTPAAVTDEYGNIEQNTDILTELESCPAMPQLSQISLKKRVMLLHPSPAADYDNITFSPDTAAVLHLTYHSGTIPERAAEFISKCRKQNIPFFLCSLKRSSQALYETSSRLMALGAVPLYDITEESAYAKLLLAVNLFPDNIEGFMKKQIYFEMLSQ